MKKTSKKGWQVLIPFFLLTMFAPRQLVFSTAAAKQITCPAPNVTVTDRTATSIGFAWDSVAGGTVYKVWYTREEDNYTSSVITTGSHTISFTNLPAGTYTFYFSTVCPGESSTNYVFEDILMG